MVKLILFVGTWNSDSIKKIERKKKTSFVWQEFSLNYLKIESKWHELKQKNDNNYNDQKFQQLNINL